MRLDSIPQIFLLMMLALVPATAHAQVLGDPTDVSQDFQKMENVYFVGSRISSFDPATGHGTLQWDRDLQTLSLVPRARSFALREDPQAGKVNWEIKLQ